MGAQPLSITQRQVTAILKGAAAAGVHLEIKAERGVVRFVPANKPDTSSAIDREPKGYL